MRTGPSTRARAALAGAALVALVGGGCTSAVIEDDAGADTILVAPTTTSELANRAPVTSTTLLPALPVPEPLPLDAYAPTPEVVLGRVMIPSIGLDEPLHQGMTLTAINRGPSHWPGTALPGQVGNMVLAGHRTTYSQPFHDLDLVQPGDQMIVEAADGGRHTYVARSTEVVSPDALWIAEQTYAFTATTFACHPKGSARERIVVHWQLVDEAGEPVPRLA